MGMRKQSLSQLLLCRRYTSRIIASSIPSLSSFSSPSSSIEPQHFANTSNRHFSMLGFHRAGDSGGSVRSYKFSLASPCYRSFSTDGEKATDDPKGEELLGPGFFDGDCGSGADVGISGEVTGAIGSGEELILPVRFLVWLLDTVHDHTSMPWWMVIIISTLALRVAILPVLAVQLHKLKRNAELAPKLPPPLPLPFSGKSWIEQYKSFRDKKKELGCPSFLWVLAYPSVQIPCFILGTASVRQMALNHHSGFECGGTLWFQNLIELPHGATGYIFPLLLASLHLVNVQVSFEKNSLMKQPNLIGVLAKYYRYYLQCVTIPIIFAGFYLPQGSLIYWTANSSITLVQQLAMKHSHVRKIFGLPDRLAPADFGKSHEIDGLESKFTVPLVTKSIQELSVLELFNLSIKHLSKGERNRAVPLLRLALTKDPEYVRALIVMGQILMKDEKLVDATEYLERALAKLLSGGHPTEVEEIDHLILASLWSGVALAKQGKVEEGIVHLERIANMKEPEDEKTKTHYYDGLLILSSALASVGRNAESTKYLRILSTYDPAYSEYLKDVESEDMNLANDLENSRRRDY